MKAVNDFPDRTDPTRLLEAFVASNRCDKAFSELVDCLRGLVFSSALRRTGNAQLAEEISQNVFALMARKAKSLQRHPSLTAWALKTTRLQAANALRSEGRRQRKMAALIDEAQVCQYPRSHAMDEQSPWKEAVPLLDEALDRLSEQDQKLILQRYYEEKKFKEIANQNGQTEAACRKRVQRSLEKLSSLLTSRGVALSGAAVGSLLGAELARAVPVHSAATFASTALAASSSLSTTTILTNTLQTMSTFKTNSLAAAAVLALLTIPLSRQMVEGSRLRSELRASEDQRSVTPLLSTRRISSSRRSSGKGLEPRSARSFLAILNGSSNNRALIRALITAESLNKSMAWGQITEMSPEELKALLDDLLKFPCDQVTKDLLMSQINEFAPEESYRDRLERMIIGGRRGLVQRHMKDWAVSEPDEALKWYLEKRGSGKLTPGLNDEMHENVLTDLVIGMAESSPVQALELYRDVPRDEMDSLAPRWVASAFTKDIIESGDESFLVRMLKIHRGKDRGLVLRGAFGEFAREGQFDAGMALVDRHNDAPEERNDYLEDLFRYSLGLNQLEGGLDWVSESTPEAEIPEVMGITIGRVARRNNLAAREWVGRQEPGLVRDVGHAAIADRMVELSDFPEAMDEAGNINDDVLRAETRQTVGRKWLEENRESAEGALPAEVLEQLQNQ